MVQHLATGSNWRQLNTGLLGLVGSIPTSRHCLRSVSGYWLLAE